MVTDNVRPGLITWDVPTWNPLADVIVNQSSFDHIVFILVSRNAIGHLVWIDHGHKIAALHYICVGGASFVFIIPHAYVRGLLKIIWLEPGRSHLSSGIMSQFSIWTFVRFRFVECWAI